MGTHAEELKRKSFEDAARPLIKWLNENVHPHHKVIVTPVGAELVEGAMSMVCHDYTRG